VDSSQPDIDDGHVGRDLYDWIAKSFDTGDFKVFALHHHLIPVPMTGREEQIPVDSGDVLELLDRCDVDLVLCGHRHVPYVWRLNEMFVVNAGTACSNKVKARTTQCYNLIEIDDGALRICRVLPSGEQELVADQVMPP
jgi:3',5'-cyclic AMP phosphodiesterase CpdA